jgi:hypothetical protein
VPTAQDRYKQVLRDSFGPELRHRGFKGSGATYELPDRAMWRLLGFQSSRWNDRDRVRFTVNLLACDKSSWAAKALERGYPARPKVGVLYGPAFMSERLGTLAFGEDTWWEILASQNPERVVRDVMAVIDSHGIPRLRQQAPETD